MKIHTNNKLGFREIFRLTSFINLMIDKYPNDCINSVFSYDLRYDEPFIINIDNITLFYASDYDIAFDASNNAMFI